MIAETKTILIAHPDTSSREEIARRLRSEGFAVLEAHEGGRALDVARRTRPELALGHLQLERPDGLEVIHRMIGQREALGTVVMVIDEARNEQRAADLLAAGVVDVVAGVSRPRELVARVRARAQTVVAPPPRSIGRRTRGSVEPPTDAESLVTAPGFVERLVDCAGDAIIAADRRGILLLFNRAAERITGYSAEEVVGQMSVANIYPEGVAKEIMKKIRAPEYGGVGRAGPLEAEIVARDGTAIPIHLHASLLYEGSTEIASVGFFTDLRARREIENKLKDAQEQLISAEKAAAVTELAGTTAHELNQPLSGIMGYTELLLRKLPDDHPARETALAIQDEVERMAAVVKKIGRITHYETQSYVGKTRIVDLDRSSE